MHALNRETRNRITAYLMQQAIDRLHAKGALYPSEGFDRADDQVLLWRWEQRCLDAALHPSDDKVYYSPDRRSSAARLLSALGNAKLTARIDVDGGFYIGDTPTDPGRQGRLTLLVLGPKLRRLDELPLTVALMEWELHDGEPA